MDPFAALADPVRRDLLRRLSLGPSRVVDLAAAYDISRPAVSKHLRVLTDAGLVLGRTVGRERWYEGLPQALRPVAELVDELTGHRPRVPEHALDALDLEVRRTVRERSPDERSTTRKDTG